MLVNLVTNAGEAIGERPGSVLVVTGSEVLGAADDRYVRFTGQSLPTGRYTFVEVRDDGSGIDPATLGRIFDPFFSTRFAGRGLGLPVVLGIVRGHRAGIAVESASGAGTVVRVVLPATDAGRGEAP